METKPNCLTINVTPCWGYTNEEYLATAYELAVNTNCSVSLVIPVLPKGCKVTEKTINTPPYQNAVFQVMVDPAAPFSEIQDRLDMFRAEAEAGVYTEDSPDALN